MRGGGGSLRDIREIGVGERGGVCVGGMRGCRGKSPVKEELSCY